MMTTTDTIIENLTTALLQVGITTLVGFLCILCRVVIGYFRQRTEDDQVKRYLEEIDRVVDSGIWMVEQTLVTLAKKQGSWNEETQEAAAERCAEYVESALSDAARNYLASNTDSLRRTIDELIHARLGELHQN